MDGNGLNGTYQTNPAPTPDTYKCKKLKPRLILSKTLTAGKKSVFNNDKCVGNGKESTGTGKISAETDKKSAGFGKISLADTPTRNRTAMTSKIWIEYIRVSRPSN